MPAVYGRREAGYTYPGRLGGIYREVYTPPGYQGSIYTGIYPPREAQGGSEGLF